MTQTTVYYLIHKDTGLGLKWYSSLSGARIAQRKHNHRLGFVERVERVMIEDNWEVELCRDRNNHIVEATYCIVEDTIDAVDLTISTVSQNDSRA